MTVGNASFQHAVVDEGAVDYEGRDMRGGRRASRHWLLVASSLSLGFATSAFPIHAQTAGEQTGQTQQPASTTPPADQDEISDDQFRLDIDNNMDIGVAWPDMKASSDGGDIALPAPHPEGADKEQPRQDVATESPPEEPDSALAKDDNGDADAVDTPAQVADGKAVTSQAEDTLLADDGSERRYQVTVEGIDDLPDNRFKERFNGLSLLQADKGKPANIAQINRRMNEDRDLIDRIMRAEGYYDARIRSSILPPEGGGEGKLRIVFNIRPGTRYTLSHVTLPGLAVAASRVPMLRTAFPIEIGYPVDADDITAAQANLTTALGANGFPFATVEEPQVTIDHESQKGDLEVVVRPGGYRHFGAIVLDDKSSHILSARHLGRIARFDKGDVFNTADLEDLRRAIVATSLASSVTVKPRDAGDGEHADVAVSIQPAKMRTVAGEIGYGTGEGYRLEASWQHRNFFPPEGAVTVRGLLGTKEQAAGVSYRKNNFLRRDNILAANLSVRNQQFDVYKAKTVTLTANIERQTNIIYQKKWIWSAGVELLASRERDFFGGSPVETSRDYFIAAVPLSVTYDTSDDLLDPKKGFRIGGRFSPEAAWQGGAYTYARVQLDGSAYVPVGERVVIASRVRLGSIVGGVDVDRIAPSRRYYAGGGASVRGYAYQAIGPRDPDGEAVGGKSLAEFSIEARVRFGNFGVVPFVDAGNIATGFLPRLNDVRFGAGLGLRYYSSFGPIRIDVGTPLNPQRGDSRLAVYVSLGQAF